jgi:hypothetical protein
MSFLVLSKWGWPAKRLRTLVHPSTGHEIETDQIHEMRPEMITAPRIYLLAYKMVWSRDVCRFAQCFNWSKEVCSKAYIRSSFGSIPTKNFISELRTWD